jgi:DNA primase
VAEKEAPEVLELGGREVRVTNPSKLYFSAQVRLSKLDVVRYYLAVADGALRGIRDRPVVLKRFVDGAEGAFLSEARAREPPALAAHGDAVVTPSGRTADEAVVDDAAGLAWIVNLGCIELHPHRGARRRRRPPGRAARRSRSGPGVRGPKCGASRWR